MEENEPSGKTPGTPGKGARTSLSPNPPGSLKGDTEVCAES